MNILELDSFNLADAVKFNDELNPRIWQGSKMRPEVREKLLEIAEDFREFLGVDNLDVRDITVSGSNASYHYTPYSDIDLHLVVDVPKLKDDAIFRELFDAKKYQYNDLHNIKIGGYDVELYVEDAGKPPVSQGIFSVLNNDWINIPRKRRATVDDTAVKSKYEDIKHRIESALKDKDFERIDRLAKKIKAYRQAGLDKHGEFGPENIAFKMLRNQGYIKKLYDARNAARDAELSLAEQNREKKPFVYGFKSVEEDATLTPDGVNPTTCMFLNEEDPVSDEDILKDFITFVAKELKLKELPIIKLRRDPQWPVVHTTFGRYIDDNNMLEVAWGQRHIMDVLRTVAHELTHRRQHEREDVPMDAGETGSPYENEANARAGILMRDYARLHPEYFNAGQATGLHGDEVNESASGYIPKNKKEAQDPRYAMALTVDIKPGQTGKEANKMALKTDRQGKPALLIKSANLLKEFQEFKAGILQEDEDLFEVKMTSKNLAKLAKDIKGVKVGLEFEMIVPNARVEDSDMEPDYDQDQRVRDIDDAVNFFDDGDYNSRNELRRLRENMESDFFDWQHEKIDELWNSNDGWDFFTNYLDREDPFDEEEAEEEARNELQAQYGDDITPEEFQTMLNELVEEKSKEYYQEQWDEQGRNYDNAREEFEDEQRDELTEEDWLDSQGIRYASDVESTFGHVTWPYYTSGSDDETDIERVALDFMNGIGADSVAYSSSYHGSYKKWVGNGWVLVGSEKPDDCFSIEPDGSLDGNSSDDVGLEFVSPPTPLEQVPDLMKRVQSWAADNGVYTGKRNKTSIHTNISVPGYDLDKLDYLKAALLLGDEYVLREFDRIGNSYAAPAIEKVKQLVQQKPEKAQELLDKMKSQLNAAASKLIHSGQTNKFTSINTKDNRVEFRSPGGDYLSIIADNPQKMIDTINRMVVTLDAAMDPDKYKQEYQKKLYKVLTGQGGGREAKSGLKQAMKASDKDLINIFTRYAAGELPKQALKSFVRQAQLERSVAKGKQAGKMWWNVQWDANRRMEVVAGSPEVAKQVAAEEWGVPEDRLAGATVTPLRPYKEGETTQQPEIPGSNIYRITDTRGGLIAGDEYESDQAALRRAQYWAQQRNTDVIVRNARGEEVGRVSRIGDITPAAPQPSTQFGAARGAPNYAVVRDSDGTVVHRFHAADRSEALGIKHDFVQMQGWGQRDYSLKDESESTPVPGSTLDLQRQRAAAAQQNQGNWGIWVAGASRFAREPGEYPAGQEVPLRRFPSREAAEQFLAQTRESNPRMRADVEVREIEPTTAQQSAGEPSSYELYRISDGRVVTAPAGNPIVFRATSPEDAESKIARYAADFNLGAPQLFAVRSVLNVPSADAAQGGIVDVAGEQPATAPRTLTVPGQPQQQFTGEWKVVDPNGNEIYRFGGVGNSQSDANRVAMQWLQRNPRHMVGGVEVLPVMG